MKKPVSKLFVLSFLFLCLTSSMSAQGEHHSWELKLSKFTELIDCLRISDTSFIVLAQTAISWPFNTGSEYVIIHYSVSGHVQWHRRLQPATVTPRALLPEPSGWKVLGMDYATTTKGVATHIHLDSTGETIRVGAFPTGETPNFALIQALDDNLYAVLTSNNEFPVVNVYSSDDRILWSRTIQVDYPIVFYGRDKARNGLILSGRAMPNDTNPKSHTFLARFSLAGELEWSRTLNPPVDEYNTGVTSLADGTFLTYGFRREERTDPHSTLAVTRVSSRGDSIDGLEDTHSAYPVPTDLIQREGGEVLICWADGFSGSIGHITFYEIGEVDQIVFSGSISPVKLLHLNDSTIVVFDDQRSLNEAQTTLEAMHIRIIILRRQNTLSVRVVSADPESKNIKMNLR